MSVRDAAPEHSTVTIGDTVQCVLFNHEKYVCINKGNARDLLKLHVSCMTLGIRQSINSIDMSNLLFLFLKIINVIMNIKSLI